jgi:hypothetical protein
MLLGNDKLLILFILQFRVLGGSETGSPLFADTLGIDMSRAGHVP